MAKGVLSRLALSLCLLALGVSFASGAHLLDSHESWGRHCNESSKHFCNETTDHDASSCAICVVLATPYVDTLDPIPQVVVAGTPFALPVSAAEPRPQDLILHHPRGPPLLAF
ncbi:MAG TPA: hypothetical protein VEN81_00210 [Planctomycetota bacterium]|nr:hypothetical protein [Planctomycetota bacterium]